MHRPLLALAAFAATAVPALCQSNTIPGLTSRLTNTDGPAYFGRRGAAHPNGEISMSYSYYMCNSGTVVIPWLGPQSGPAPMQTDHPMFAYMVVRESNGRFEQVTNRLTYSKHASSSANSSGACGTCIHPGTNTAVGIGCSDAYGATTNSNRFYLGPDSEIDPWTCTWNPVGSYFDRGDPAVAWPQDQDGVRSLTSGMVGTFTDLVKNRVVLRESDLLTPGRFFVCLHLLVGGEDADARADNIGHREVVPSWNGATWSFALSGVPFTNGTVLNQWAGATVNTARNGEDDGHFYVAVKVTGPVAGLYHYEYAVQNFDNNRGGASLRIPVCPSTPVSGVGFRDTDDNPLSDWTWSQAGCELAFLAAPDNALDWNSIYNFWFDSPQPPVAGSVTIDQARPGAGALEVAVAAQVPSGIAGVSSVGPGCGSPPPVLGAVGEPSLGNATFHLTATVAPIGALFVVLSFGQANVALAPGCFQYLDPATLTTLAFYVADNTGVANVPIPIPNDPVLDGIHAFNQAAELVAGGPVLGAFAVSNGLEVALGCH